MTQSYSKSRLLNIPDHSISLSKLLIDDTSIQYNFNADMVDDCHVSKITPTKDTLSDSLIITDTAMRDFIYPINFQYKQYPIPITVEGVLMDVFVIEETPAYLFGGSWRPLPLLENSGLFFRTEKTGETGRDSLGTQNSSTAKNGIGANTLTNSSHYHPLNHYHLCFSTGWSRVSVYQDRPVSVHSSGSGKTEYSLNSHTGDPSWGPTSTPLTTTTGWESHAHGLTGAVESIPDNRLFKIWERYA